MEENTRRKIVYLDDVFLSLTMIKEKLKNTYEVYVVQTVEKMFETLKNTKAELILLDINMPKVDGFEVLKRLKADEKCSKIPVMFITSSANKSAIIKGIELGAVGYLPKNASSADLVETIEYYLDPEIKAGVKPIILAIDDDPSILQTINHLLNDIYTVYTMPGAKNKNMVKELLKKIKPDLFLLDCHMPHLGGYDLVPIIRGTQPHEDTPIVFLTADGTVDNLNAAIKTEAADFIVKPIDKEVLRQRLDSHLKNFMTRRQIRAIDDAY